MLDYALDRDEALEAARLWQDAATRASSRAGCWAA